LFIVIHAPQAMEMPTASHAKNDMGVKPPLPMPNEPVSIFPASLMQIGADLGEIGLAYEPLFVDRLDQQVTDETQQQHAQITYSGMMLAIPSRRTFEHRLMFEFVLMRMLARHLACRKAVSMMRRFCKDGVSRHAQRLRSCLAPRHGFTRCQWMGVTDEQAVALDVQMCGEHILNWFVIKIRDASRNRPLV
jgi:hypothetical protein